MQYHFHGQRTQEEVVLFSKQHPFVLLHPFLISVCMALVPVLVYSFTDSNSVLSLVVSTALLASLVHAGLALYSWNNTLFLLTTERIVLLQQKHFFHREFAECDLVNIQQVSHEVHGLYHTLFGYGNIAVHTGASQLAFLIPNIPDPYDTQQEILRVRAGEGFVEE